MEELMEKKKLHKYSMENIMEEIQQKLTDERLQIDHKDEKLARKRVLLSEMIRQAVAGDQNAKNYVINKIIKTLTTEMDINNENINYIINFNDIQKLPYYYQFHILTLKYDISKIIDKYNDQFGIIDFSDAGNNIFHKETFEKIMESETREQNLILDYIEKINVIANIVYAEVYGLSIIDRIEFMDINEVGVNGFQYIWIQHRGSKIWLEFLEYPDNNLLNNVCKNAVSFNSKVDLSPSNPGIICQRYDGSRITCSLQPFYSEPTLNLRRFNLGNFNPDKMVNLGTIDELSRDLLKILIMGRSNIIIAGGMGDGKSTTLMTLINFVPGSRAIGTIEENLELRLKTRHPSKNVIEAQAVPGKPISSAFEFMLKQARDIVILGEITNSEEATQLINVMLRLCRGSMGTFHSENPKAVIINLRNLLLKSGFYHNEMVAQADVVEAVNIVIQMTHDNKGRRFVDYITEIEPVADAEGAVITSNFRPRHLMERINGEFHFANTISEDYAEKLIKYGATREGIDEINALIKERMKNNPRLRTMKGKD
ncbi:MAG: ATPase, T2SS/T4P/T4SS family [Deltaproteobacteria bacterium]